jgi:hypothetical protein
VHFYVVRGGVVEDLEIAVFGDYGARDGINAGYFD